MYYEIAYELPLSMHIALATSSFSLLHPKNERSYIGLVCDIIVTMSHLGVRFSS